MRGPTGNSDANQRLAWEQVTTTSRLKEKGRECIATSIQGWSYREEAESRMAWLAEATKETLPETTPLLQLSKADKEGKALASPTSYPPISCQFLSLANPARNCWHQSLGRNEAHKGQLLTILSGEGKGEEWIWGQTSPGSAEIPTLLRNIDDDGGGGGGNWTESVVTQGSTLEDNFLKKY